MHAQRTVLVAHVVPVVVDAVIGLALSLIAHVVVVVFVVAILHRIFLYGRYTLYISDHNVFLQIAVGLVRTRFREGGVVSNFAI